MRALFLLITSLCLSTTAHAHSSLVLHMETDRALLHALIHTGISVVLAALVYLLVRKVFAPKRLRFKRH